MVELAERRAGDHEMLRSGARFVTAQRAFIAELLCPADLDSRDVVEALEEHGAAIEPAVPVDVFEDQDAIAGGVERGGLRVERGVMVES